MSHSFCAINVISTTSSCGRENKDEEKDSICMLWHLHFVINIHSVYSAAVWCFLKFNKLRCEMLRVGWKRSTVRVCDSSSYLWKQDGLHETAHLQMPPVMHQTVLHITPKLTFKFKKNKSSSWSMSTKGTNNNFYLISNSFVLSKWVGFFLFFFQNRLLNPSVPRVITRESTRRQQKNYTY